MRKQLLLGWLLTFSFIASYSQALPLREQAGVINSILEERLNSVLPGVMVKNGIDCWIVMSREYNEDPVLRTMLPAEWLNARRRTIFVFYNNPVTGDFEKLAIARYNVGGRIKAAWDTQRWPDQWDALINLLTTRNPRHIAIDSSADFGAADGLDHTDFMELERHLPPAYRERIISAQPLAVGWLETRSPMEMELYPRLIDFTHGIIAEAFSANVIVPGVTSTEDVEWWLRQRIRDKGFDTWFHPSVDIQREDSPSHIILPGDLLHVDFGITYLRLNTDVQEHAYVLKQGETSAPASIRAAFARAGRLQDILTSQFAEGRTGNQILASALAEAKKEGIQASIYTHPIGYHGHGAGPAIGLWDHQEGVPGSGDFPMHQKTAYSIELNARSEIPEWHKTVRIMLEEDGYFGEGGFRYIHGRQTDIYLIPRNNMDGKEITY